jgi:hypothetical protein
LVAKPRLRSWAAALGQAEDPEDPDLAVQRQGNDASDVDVLARFLDSPAVDANVPGLDYGLRQRAALHQPDAVQIAVDSHFFFSFASSAKA